MLEALGEVVGLRENLYQTPRHELTYFAREPPYGSS